MVSSGLRLLLSFLGATPLLLASCTSRDARQKPVEQQQEDHPAPAVAPVPAPAVAPVPASTVAPKAAKVAELTAHRREGELNLDGKLDEADWHLAGDTGPMVSTLLGTAGSFVAGAKVLYDAESIYVAFEVTDDYLKSKFSEHDDHLWEQDTVEVMVDPDGDGQNYFEIQVAPTGVIFETAYERWRHPRPFGHVNWTSSAEAGVALRGKVNDEAADEGYTVEMRIPVSAMVLGEFHTKPLEPGTTLRMNFFVMDARERGQRAVGWSAPLVGDFHKLDRFGVVHLQ